MGAAPLAFAQAAASPKRVQVVDTIVAVVNNEVITSQELEEKVRLAEGRMKAQGIAAPPRAEFKRQLLERLIIDRAQMQLAKEMGIRADDLMLDRAVAGIAEQNKLSMQEFRNRLEADGIPFGRFREEIREEIIKQRLREREVESKVQISEAEVDTYLAAATPAPGAGAPSAPIELNLAQILVRIPENASSEQIAQRLRRAEDALQQLKSGNDFAKVAATYSDASDSLKGGDLGWRTPDRLPQLFLDAVINLNTGDVSRIVKSANGFHIIKFVGKRTPSVMTGGPSAAPAVQQTHARHILIKVNQTTTASEARRRLVELKERLDNKAAKFEDLARQYSNDFSSSKGGDLGWIYPGDTVPEFERALNALQIGQVSEPIESQFGYHLIQVLERKTDDVSKERQRMTARNAIRERKIEEANEEWLRQLRDRAYVEYRNDDNHR
jgi:peptidyl-prolyl cis-trans isomerase SurA